MAKFFLVVYLTLLGLVVKACPFAHYEEGLINRINQTQERILSLPPLDGLQGDSIGFGFWSFCIPLQTIKQQITIQSPFKTLNPEDGQFFFLIKSLETLSNVLIYYLSFDQDQKTVNHKLIIDDGQNNIYTIEKPFLPYNYEGIWILTYFTIQSFQKKIIIEITNQQAEVKAFSLQFGQYQFIIGGEGYVYLFNLFQIQISSQFYNLNYFKGRLSLLIYEQFYKYDLNHFHTVSELCKIPSKYEGEQTIAIVKELKITNPSEALRYEIEQYGNRYVISGWVKYDASKLISSSIYSLIKISAFQDFTNYLYIGDEIFQITYCIFEDPALYTHIQVRANKYDIPLQGSEINLIIEQGQYDQNVDNQNPNYSMFDAVQEWHFFQYEYGRSVGYWRSWYKVQFKNSMTPSAAYFLNYQEGSFTNSIFYVNIGKEANLRSDSFQGNLYNFQISYNYESDKFFNIACHYTCFECYGPFNNHCISCPANSNRFFENETTICKCKADFLEVINDPVCYSFQNQFPSIVEIEDQDLNTIFCPFGYFRLPVDNQNYICILCPQKSQKFINCLDCLFEPLSWYLNPICTKDLVTIGNFKDTSFSLLKRNPLDFDFFVIDLNNNLVLFSGIQEFCDSETSNICSTIQLKSFEKEISIKCKQNHYFDGQICILSDFYCIKTNNQGLCEQCQIYYYLLDNHCYRCPNACNECYYNKSEYLKVSCIACNEGWALVNGDCLKCGLNCRICFNYNDIILKKSYLRCYRCLDDRLFFVSFDAINCIENTIQYCLSAFQVLKDDYTVNTLNYNFQPINSDQIVTFCAFCDLTHGLFIIPSLTCETQYYINCRFSISLVQNPTPDEQICISITQFEGYYIQFQIGCSFLSRHCDTCIQGKQIGFFQCLICSAGYYSIRLTGICEVCPSELNCKQCYQQDKYIKDHWKINSQAFYKYIVNSNSKHSFNVYGQSQNMDDYEIVCQSCKQGYELYGSQCILACPDSCLECQLINGQNICIKCPQGEFGRQLSLNNNQCIQCSLYCALCRIRTTEEIKVINPLFKSDQFYYTSNQCLRSYENLDIQLYYDQFLGQFVKCENLNTNCQRKMIIEIFLYCSKNEYEYDLNNQLSDLAKTKFKQRNIYIDDLFTDQHSNFNQFEITSFYINANEKTIKTIEIKIISQKQQSCFIKGNKVLSQLFSQNIFSAINIQLSIVAFQDTSFQIEQSITFSNFQLISISGITFISLQNTRSKYLKFQSIFPMSLNFYDSKFKQFTIELNSFQIIVENTLFFSMEKCQIQNLRLSDLPGFLQIYHSPQIKSINISNLIFENNLLTNTDLISVDIADSLQIGINDVTIFNCHFINGKLLFLEKNNKSYQISLKLSNIQIVSDITLTNGFFDLGQFTSIILLNIEIINSNLINSNIILIANTVQINSFTVQNSVFQNSITLMNEENNILSQLNFLFTEVNFNQNQYDETSKFILINQYSTNYISLQIYNLNLSNNSITTLSDEILLNDQNLGLIYIQVLTVIIENLKIERGMGIQEFSFINIDTLVINNLIITQNVDFFFFGIHQYLDCVLKNLKSRYYPPSLSIVSSKQISLKNIQISQTYMINYPLILFFSPDIFKEIQNVLIQNGIILQNFLMIEKIINNIALININSKSSIKIKFENLTFRGNVLHEYIQSELIKSAPLIFVDCITCELLLYNSIFDQNLVINSTDSILNFKVKQVVVDKCFFDGNNKFQLQIILPFLLWGFLNDETIYQEQLERIFQINSFSGNGLFQSELIIINNCSIINSSGAQGGAFKIITQNDANFQCINTLFESISTFFSKGIESGGVFNIDSSSSTSSLIKISNIQVYNVFCRSTGGLLHILAGKGNTNIYLFNLQIQNVYAKLGSIIYCIFQSVSTLDQNLLINGLIVQNDLKQQAQFLSKFTNLQQQDINEILYQRTSIYVIFGSSCIIQNTKIMQLYNEGLIQVTSVKSFIVYLLEVFDCSHPVLLINVLPPSSNYLQIIDIIMTIRVTGLKLSKIRQKQLINIFNQCKSSYQLLKSIQFYCLDTILQNQSAHNIIYNLIDRAQEMFLCLMNDEIFAKSNSGYAGVISITDLFLINFIKISKSTIDQIDCQACNLGLIYISHQLNSFLSHPTQIKNILIANSQCGLGSCFTISKGKLEQPTRLLDELQNSILISKQEIEINSYQCFNNSATFGTCLTIHGFIIYLQNSFFLNNNALTKGGALQFLTDTANIIDSFIVSNMAEIGGGVYIQKNTYADYQKQRTILSNNVATFYGNNSASLPNSLVVSFNRTIGNLRTYSIQQTENIFIQGIMNSTYLIYLPSGQKISKYYYFDWIKQTYQYPYLQFRVIAVDYLGVVQKNLQNSFCLIKSRLLNIFQDDKNQSFTNNLTNIQEIYFDNISQTFNLDDLILYFDYEQPQDTVLQLELWCSPVQVLLFNQQYPFNILRSHKNYYLRINIRTFPCTFGEIKNSTDESCYQCDSNLDQFSLTINAVKCQLRDEVTTVSVRSAQLEIRPFYWRPFFQTIDISYCLNLPQNCLGSWQPGDLSCEIGHIGALCEQCDLNNIRGDGRFSFSQKYVCGRCSENQTNLTIMITTIIWYIFDQLRSFVSLILSVRSTLDIVQKQAQQVKSQTIKLVLVYQQEQSGVLIKLFTNYLQIIASLSTFQLNISLGFVNVLNIFGNPIQAISYSQDCVLQQLSNIQIHYTRMIWQLILPFFFLALFYIFYVICIQMKIFGYNISVVTTAYLYLLIYFQPNLINSLIQLISFRKISGYKWIQNNVAFLYDTELHAKWLFQFCLPLLILISFVLPLFIFLILYFNRKKLNNIEIRKKWGYLYNEYKSNSYFWEIFKIVEKNFIIFALVYYEDDIVIKGTLVIFIVQIYQELNQYFQPYLLKQLIRIDMLTSNLCQISFTLGVGAFISNQNHLNQLPTLFFILIAFINIYFFIFLLVKILKTYFKEIEQNFDFIKNFIFKHFSKTFKLRFVVNLLESKIDKRNKILKRYKKIKHYLIPLARKIIKLKNDQKCLSKNYTVYQSNSENKIRVSSEKIRILLKKPIIQYDPPQEN